MIVILGLDIATTTGYSLFDGKILLDYGKFTLPDVEHRYRYKIFRKKILELIKKFKPNIIALEQTFVGPNIKTTAYLNMLRGICIECIPKNIEIYTDTVTRIRKEALGGGKRYDKKEIFNHVVDKFNLKNLTINKDLDVTDSILLTLWVHKKISNNID